MTLFKKMSYKICVYRSARHFFFKNVIKSLIRPLKMTYKFITILLEDTLDTINLNLISNLLDHLNIFGLL